MKARRKSLLKRGLSLFIVLTMCISMLSMPAFAEENYAQETAAAETSAQEREAEGRDEASTGNEAVKDDDSAGKDDAAGDVQDDGNTSDEGVSDKDDSDNDVSDKAQDEGNADEAADGEGTPEEGSEGEDSAEENPDGEEKADAEDDGKEESAEDVQNPEDADDVSDKQEEAGDVEEDSESTESTEEKEETANPGEVSEEETDKKDSVEETVKPEETETKAPTETEAKNDSVSAKNESSEKVEKVPVEVKAFLDAVAKIPEITRENAEEAAEYLYGEVSEAYEEIQGTEYEEREDVREAVEVMSKAIDAVDRMLEMEETDLASGYIPVTNVTINPDKKPAGKTATGKVRQSGQSLTMKVGQKASFLLGAPTNTLIGSMCGHTIAVYNPSDYCDISLIDNSGNNLVGNPTYAAGNNGGARVFDTVFEALKPGKSSDVRVCYYANFGIVFTNGANSGNVRCPRCGRSVLVYKDVTWYRYNDVFGITVNADYQLVYDTQGGSIVAPTTKSVANTKADLTVTSAVPAKKGYTFLGWSENKNATTAQYKAGATITLNWEEGKGSASDPVSKTLYAVWEKEDNTDTDTTYTVTYTDGVAGKVVFPDQGYEGLKKGDKTPAFVGIPSREGYTFTGWKLTSVTPNKIGVQPAVDPADADENREIIYTATWKDNTTGTGNEPDELKREDLYGILGRFVEVKCISTGDNLPHVSKTYSTIGETAESKIGDFYKDDGIWKVDVTLYGDMYATYYGYEPSIGTGVKHTLAEGEESTRTITLTWNITDKKWTSGQERGTILATFNVVCKSEESEKATYTVKWYDAETEKEIKAEESRTGTLNDEVAVTDADKVVEGYTFDGENEKNVLSATLTKSGIVLKLYFNKKDSTGSQTPKLKVTKDNNRLKIDPQTGNAVADYTVTVTNISGFDIYGLRLTDVLDTPTVTKVNPDDIGEAKIQWTFSNFKADGKAVESITGNASSLKHVMQLLGRNDVFKDGQKVTLTYTIELENLNDDVAVKVDLHNEAKGESWSKLPGARLFRMFREAVAPFAEMEDESDAPDVMDTDTSDTSIGSIGGGSSTEIILPKKHRVTYEWKGLPDNADEILPTEPKRPAGATVTVDTGYTNGTEITVDGTTYTFSGWSTDDAEVGENGKFIMPAKDVVIEGTWTKKESGNPNPPDKPDKPDPTPVNANYTVEWYDADTNELIKETETRTGTVGSTVSVAENDSVIDGYTFVQGHESNILSAEIVEDGSTVLKLYFTKNSEVVTPDPERKDASYTVMHEYYTNGTKAGETTQTITGKKVGDTVNISEIEKITTYGNNTFRYTSTNKESIVLAEEIENNVFILRYDRTVSSGSSGGSGGSGSGGGGSRATNIRGRSENVPVPEEETTVPEEEILDEEVPLANIPVVDIPDADVPLSGIPEELANIFDEDVPLANVPRTGDGSGMWHMMALLSMAGLMAMSMLDRKKRQEKNQ